MEIGSVNSSQSAVSATVSQTNSRQVEQDVRAQQAQARQNSGENRAAAREPSEAERNRPTVNTSGQVVGTRINTTA